MKTKSNEIPEILIPKGYEMDEVLDFGDETEEAIFEEEVRIRFEI